MNAPIKPEKFLKILVLNYEYPPIGGGGGAVSQGLAQQLAKMGHEVRVQTSWIRGLPKHKVVDSISVFRSFSFRKSADTCTVTQMFFYLFTNFFPALRHALFWKPDLIHAHFAVPTGVLAWIVGLLSRTPYILTIHLGDVPGALPEQTDGLFRILKPLTRPIWKGASSIVAVSEFVRVLGENAYGCPVKTILNGISPPQDAAFIKKAIPFQFLSVGRFNAQKNLFFMLDVLARVKSKPWNYILVGDGPLRKSLTERVRELGLEERVHFTGWLKQHEVNHILQESQVLLMPSLAEGLPMAGISALFFGLPIYGSEIDGLGDLIQHGENGFLMPLGQPEIWVEKLNEALEKPETLVHLSENARKHAENFNICKVAQAYETLFETYRKKTITITDI